MKSVLFFYTIFSAFIFLSAVAVPSASSAGAGETVSLQSLIEETQKNNPELEALRFHQQGVKQGISQATFLEDPQLSITQWGIPSDLNIGRANETWLGVGQAFPYPGKRLLKREIAEKDWEIAKQEYQAKALEVVAEVKIAYYGLSLLYTTIDLHQEHQTLLNEFIEIAEKRYAVGQSMQQDLLKAEVERTKLHHGLITLEQDIVSAKAMINALINRPEASPMGRPEPLIYRPFPFLYDTLTKDALSGQQLLQSAFFRVEKSEAMQTLTRKESRPDFMVELSYWDVHGDDNRWMAMGKMNLPWVFGGKYDAKNHKAVYDVDEAKANYTATKNKTLSQIKMLFTKIKTDEQLINSYQNRLIPLAKQSLAAARIGYQSGKTDFLNFIDSERTLLDLQMEYFMKLADYWQQVARLSPLIGKEINP